MRGVVGADGLAAGPGAGQARRVELRPVVDDGDDASRLAAVGHGVAENPDLSEQDNKTLREMVAYCWGMFDDMLRPVDSDPVGIQLKDPRQQPIKLAERYIPKLVK